MAELPKKAANEGSDFIEMPGGYKWNPAQGDAGVPASGPNEPKPRQPNYTPENFVDRVGGIGKQLSWGMNAALFAAPDWVVRKFAKNALDMGEKDAFQFSDMYRSVMPEQAPRNPEERLARALSEESALNLGISGILKGVSMTGALAKDIEKAGSTVGAIAQAPKRFAKAILDQLRQNPKEAFKQDLKWGAVSGSVRALIEEGKAPGEEKNLGEELAPAVAPIALSLSPVNLARRAYTGISGMAGKAADAVPGGMEARGMMDRLLTNRTEQQVAKSLAPLQPGMPGNTPQIQAALARSEQLQGTPGFENLNLTSAEQSMYGPLLRSQESGFDRLSGQQLADETARIQRNERVFADAISSYSPQSGKTLEQTLQELRDQLQKSDMGPLFLAGQKNITLPGTRPFSSHADAGEQLNGVIRARKAELDSQVDDAYQSFDLRAIPIAPEALVLREGEEAAEDSLRTFLDNTIFDKNIILQPELTPATVAADRVLSQLMPRVGAVEDVVEGAAQAADRIIPLGAFSKALTKIDPTTLTETAENLTTRNLIERFVTMKEGGKKTEQSALTKLEETMGKLQQAQDNLYDGKAEAKILVGKLQKSVNTLQGKGVDLLLEDYPAVRTVIARELNREIVKAEKELQQILSSPEYDFWKVRSPKKLEFGEFNLSGTPKAGAAAAEQAVEEELKPIFVQDYERTRRTLNELYKTAKNEGDERGVYLLRNALDEWFDNAVEKGLINASDGQIQALKEARDLRRHVGDIFEPRPGLPESGKAMQRLTKSGELTANDVLDTIFGSTKTPTKGTATEIAKRLELAFGKDSPEYANLGQAAYVRAMQDADGTVRTAKDAGAELDNLLTGRGAEFSQQAFTNEQRQSLVTLRGQLAQVAADTTDAETRQLIKEASRPGADVNNLVSRALRNPADMRSLVTAMGKSPEQMQSLRRQVWNKLNDAEIAATPDGIDRFLIKHGKSLTELYTPQEMGTIKLLSDAQKRIFATARTVGEIPPGLTLDQWLNRTLGTSVRGISTTMRNVAQGRGGVPDALTFFGMRFLAAKQEDIYARVLHKALSEPEYAKYLLTAKLDAPDIQALATGTFNTVKSIEMGSKIAEGAGFRFYRASRALATGETVGDYEEQRRRTLPPAPGVAAMPTPQPQATAQEMLRQHFRPNPPAPSTTGVPNLIPGAKQFSGQQVQQMIGPAKASGQSATQSRMMLQALFPRDPVSSVLAMKQQQQQQQQQPPTQ
jgi:hypothetical protein